MSFDGGRILEEAGASTFGQDAISSITDQILIPLKLNNTDVQASEGNQESIKINPTIAEQDRRPDRGTDPFMPHSLYTSSQFSGTRPHMASIQQFIPSSVPSRINEGATPKTGLIKRYTDEHTPIPSPGNDNFDHKRKNLTKPIIECNKWFDATITADVPLKVLSVCSDSKMIPLNSPDIRIIPCSVNAKFELFISIQLKKKTTVCILRIQAEEESSLIWICTFQKDTSGKIYHAIGPEEVTTSQMNTTPSANSYVHDPSVINILLIGRSQVGKSTLIEALRDPNFSAMRTGISQTREPSYKQLTITSEDGKDYTLNIIDTPGLQEVRQDPDETRTDEQLLTLFRNVFSSGKIRGLNVIAFVSVIGRTHQNDIETFKSLIDFFGERFKAISTLILTHCDKVSLDRLQILIKDIEAHPKCSDIVNYCTLGIYRHGTLDIDDLETYDEEMQERIRKSTLERLEPMRTELTKFFLSRSNNYVKITESDFERFKKLTKHKKVSNEMNVHGSSSNQQFVMKGKFPFEMNCVLL
ncbi:unnamed protein product [Adineta ricciae]|uniref:AIG1-type G domain-containing protein n=1 Tax=Adineta ricciae TaxID=249248 RepID=A0A815AU25_ADIRI|nr:unnamed protein product [Adineta ricciae]